MLPIQYQADIDLHQALRCVSYRLQPLRALKTKGFALGLSLRYGLVGIAAIHHLAQTARVDEQKWVFESATLWPPLVREELTNSSVRLPALQLFENAQDAIERHVNAIVQCALPGIRRRELVEQCLRTSLNQFIELNRSEIREGWGFWRGAAGERLFRELGLNSEEIALHFYDRRMANLEEVSEIALLGE